MQIDNKPIPFPLAKKLQEAGLPQPFGWAYTDKGVLIDTAEPLQYLGDICCAAPTYETIRTLLDSGRVNETVKQNCLKILQNAA